MTKEETLTLLRMIKAIWPKTFECDGATVAAWESSLRECSFDDCRTALKRYQNPKNDDEAKRFAYAPVPSNIYRFVCEDADRRRGIESAVMNKARRATGYYPCNSLEEREKAPMLFFERCMAQENPIKAADQLSRWLFSLTHESEGAIDKETRKTFVRFQNSIITEIEGFTFNDE
jgi:hypothetical protein